MTDVTVKTCLLNLKKSLVSIVIKSKVDFKKNKNWCASSLLKKYLFLSHGKARQVNFYNKLFYIHIRFCQTLTVMLKKKFINLFTDPLFSLTFVENALKQTVKPAKKEKRLFLSVVHVYYK